MILMSVGDNRVIFVDRVAALACMAPRASAIEEQGFSEAAAAGIEAPQEDQPDQLFADNWEIHQ